TGDDRRHAGAGHEHRDGIGAGEKSEGENVHAGDPGRKSRRTLLRAAAFFQWPVDAARRGPMFRCSATRPDGTLWIAPPLQRSPALPMGIFRSMPASVTISQLSYTGPDGQPLFSNLDL